MPKPPSPQDVEQVLAFQRDYFPRLWYALYQGSLTAGFTEAQAISLVHTYILSTNSTGIKPDTGVGPDSDQPQE